jgi:hypothetical protein
MDEEPYQCMNFPVCENRLPIWWQECKGRLLCTNCHMMFKNPLDFLYNEEECPICFDKENAKLRLSCNHQICVSCYRHLTFWDETRYHLSPVPFQGPPCPNGCVNPIKGKQCYCEEYDPVLETWEAENPVQYKAWNDAEQFSIDESIDPDWDAIKNKCPLCRTLIMK